VASFTRGRCLLRPLRIKLGLTQTDISQRTGYKKGKNIGYSPRMISFYERDEKPMSVDAMMTISFVLGVPMESLYERLMIIGSEE